MPRISYFYGISIYMCYKEHAPPHFHALYGEHEATFEIGTLETVHGGLPGRAAALVLEWANLHRAELRANWDRARKGLQVDMIAPL